MRALPAALLLLAHACGAAAADASRSAAAAAALAPPADAPLVASVPDAALEAFIEGRYVALARPGASESAVRGAVSRGVAAGLLRAGPAARDAPGMDAAALGVVTFKSSDEAAAQVRSGAPRRRRAGGVPVPSAARAHERRRPCRRTAARGAPAAHAARHDTGMAAGQRGGVRRGGSGASLLHRSAQNAAAAAQPAAAQPRPAASQPRSAPVTQPAAAALLLRPGACVVRLSRRQTQLTPGLASPRRRATPARSASRTRASGAWIACASRSRCMFINCCNAARARQCSLKRLRNALTVAACRCRRCLLAVTAPARWTGRTARRRAVTARACTSS